MKFLGHFRASQFTPYLGKSAPKLLDLVNLLPFLPKIKKIKKYDAQNCLKTFELHWNPLPPLWKKPNFGKLPKRPLKTQIKSCPRSGLHSNRSDEVFYNTKFNDILSGNATEKVRGSISIKRVYSNAMGYPVYIPLKKKILVGGNVRLGTKISQ